MKRFSSGEADPIALLEEREAILYLLPQTTPERLQKNLTGYTINPKTRYTSLSELVPPGDVTHLFDSDDPNVVNAMKSRVMQSRTSIKGERKFHREDVKKEAIILNYVDKVRMLLDVVVT